MKRAFALVVALTALASCCGLFSPEGGTGRLSLMSYNVAALFDARDEGTEYAEFSVARGSWSEGLYRRRLGKLAEAVLAAPRPEGASGPPGPDLLCLEEVETEAVLAELSEGELREAKYSYRAFARSPGTALGLGLLSRYPVLAARAHGLRVGALVLRPLLEVELQAPGGRLIVLVCHWKSKTEGAEATEAQRRECAAQATRVAGDILRREPGVALLLCGDFNENPDEYYRVGRRYPTALLPAGEAGKLGEAARGSLLVAESLGEAGQGKAGLSLYSPWKESDAYSYRYQGKPERIDGFLLSPGLRDGVELEYAGFQVLDAGFLMDGEGKPLAWSSSRASGYSDHLPILLYLETASGGS